MSRDLMTIVLWKWQGDPNNPRMGYTGLHVDIMAAMLRRQISKVPYRVICITDDPLDIHDVETFPLWDDLTTLKNQTNRNLPSCYRRLKLYDPATQRSLGIREGDRIMSIDLDTVVTGQLDDLLRTEGRFVGWELPGTYHPRVLNGSLQMFTAGDLAEVWTTFDPDHSPLSANVAGYMGSDQAWLSKLLAPRLGHDVIGLKWPWLASYAAQSRIQGLFGSNRLVFFHGNEKPWMPIPQRDTPWITRYWRLDR